MSRWFRFYEDSINDPKILKLSDRLYRFWVGILCVASKYNGELPARDDVALHLRMKPEKVEEAVNELMAAGLVDEENGVLFPHNWRGRQYKGDVTDPTNAQRQKRYRERHRNVVSNGVTSVITKRPETETDKDAADAAPEVDLFRRGREVLGKDSGGLIAKLLASKNKSIPLARAAIEHAATKENPREYVGAVIRGKQKADEPQWLDGIPGVL